MSETTHVNDPRTSVAGALLRGLAKAIVWLCAAMVLSVLIEWLGMMFIWPEQGIGHSAAMFDRERAYLAEAANQIPILRDQHAVMDSAQRWASAGTTWTGLVFLSGFDLGAASDYVGAAMNSIGVFVYRLFVLLLATPAFVIFGIVGLTRGLVARELRKWSGGRETAGTYHLALRILPDVTLGLWVIYLAMPVSINPFLIVGPVVILFALVLQQLAYRFKKYV